MTEPTLQEIASAVRRLADESDRRLSVDMMGRLSPAHRMGGDNPPDPIVGYTPFDVPVTVASGAIDWSALAAGLFTPPVASTHANPTKGTASSLPLADHDHGLVKGPPLEGLAIGYAGPAQPNSVVRTDTPGGVVSTTTITYSGTQVLSVVTVRSGYTITVVPTYVGTDITGIGRTVA